jgi:hypothetical protein
MESLPAEIYSVIIGDRPDAYRAMLGVPGFARGLDHATICTYQRKFNGKPVVCGRMYAFVVGTTPHRYDRPAVVYNDIERVDHQIYGPDPLSRAKLWMRHGRLHRKDGPAVVTATGQHYHRHGTLVDSYGNPCPDRMYLHPLVTFELNGADGTGRCRVELNCGCVVARQLLFDRAARMIVHPGHTQFSSGDLYPCWEHQTGSITV